jgi:ribosome biogenesis GTPase
LIDIFEWGWEQFFIGQTGDEQHEGLSPARIIEERKDHYRLMTEQGESTGEISGLIRFSAAESSELPAVGDWVMIDFQPMPDRSIIQSRLTRKSAMARTRRDDESPQILAANLDTAFIISALDRELNLNRIQRYMAIAEEGGVLPVVVLTRLILTLIMKKSEQRSKKAFQKQMS